MQYRFKVFTEKEYEAFCEKAGIHPCRCEHTANDGQYHFRWFYLRKKDFYYHQYILGAFEHPDGERITLVDKAHELWKKNEEELSHWIRTPEGREAFKKCHRCYPEDLVYDCEDHHMPKPRWKCKGKYVSVYEDYKSIEN